MIFPDWTTEEWAKKHKLSVETGTCPKCGIGIIADKPFADGKLRGFMSEDHGCGIERTLVVFNADEEFMDILFSEE